MRRLEEAERNIRLSEAKIAERDQRISEVERLLDCMAQVRQTISMETSHGARKGGNSQTIGFLVLQEKAHLTQKLCDCEKRLRSFGEDQPDSRNTKM